MTLDERYGHVKSIWVAGDLKSFHKIFTIVPKSIISEDLGLNYGRFARKVNNPELLNFQELQHMSKLIGVDLKSLVELVLSDIEEDIRARRR